MTDSIATCPNCAKPNDPGSAYCVHCGVALPASSPTPGNSPPPPPASPPPPRPTAPVPGLSEHPASLSQRGFLASLFDVSFTSLVTTKLVRVIYLLAMIWIGLTALVYILVAFHLSPGVGILVLFVVAPVSSLFMLGFTRILLELCIGLFQIMANSNELVAQGRRDASS